MDGRLPLYPFLVFFFFYGTMENLFKWKYSSSDHFELVQPIPLSLIPQWGRKTPRVVEFT
jgi:hypothetical protein